MIWQFIYLSFNDQELSIPELNYKQDDNQIIVFQIETGMISKKWAKGVSTFQAVLSISWIVQCVHPQTYFIYARLN